MNGKSRILADLILLVFLSLLCLSCSVGYGMTVTETNQSITIPMEQWQTLTNDCKALNSELISYKSEIQRLKKPSAELLSQLEMAEKTLKQLQTELAEQTKDLTALSNEAEESRTSLQILKQQIDRERKIHKRQIWQNRFWCILIGAGIGYAASR